MTIQRTSILDQPAHYLEGADFQIIVPEESTNLITNPSFETGTAGWVNNAAVSMARSASQSFFGAASLRVQTNTNGAGAYFDASSAIATSTTYTFTAYLRGLGTVFIFVYGATSGFIVTRTIKLTNDWRRYAITFTFTGADALRAAGVYQSGSGTADIYIDGAQLEAKPYATTYIDGEQDDCIWIGATHNSSSYRPATTRKGGRPMKLSDYKFRVISVIGAGAAALTTVATPYANIGGAYYQRSIPQSRALQIVGAFECRSHIDLMRNRAALIDAVNPNRTPNPQATRLLYTPLGCSVDDPTRQVVIDGVYAGGLEGNQTNEAGIERAVLGFNVYLPYAAIGQSQFERNQAVDFVDAVSRNYLIRRSRTSGAWDTTPTDPTNGVTAIVKGEDGYTYVAGHFTNIGGHVAQWDNQRNVWANTFVVGASDPVYALARGFGGDIFIGGEFTTFDGGAAASIVRHRDGTTYSMGAGTNGTVYAIAVAPDGSVYAGGDFTTAGGGAASNVAKWDGSSWSALSTGLNSVVTALAVAADGTLYAGGVFTGSGITGRVAKWNGSTWEMLGGGVAGGTNEVYAIAVAPDGRVYVGGDFDTAGGAIYANNIAMWNGAGWSALGVGTDYAVNALSFAPDGTLHVGGAFGTAGGLPTNGYAEWNGSVFIASDQDGGPVNAIMSDDSWTWLGYALGSTGVTSTSGLTTISLSVYSANTRIKFAGPGRLTSLRNWTSGARMYFDLDLQAGETVTLSLSPSVIGQPMLESSARGDITSLILPSSTPANKFLTTGSNLITAYIDGSTGSTSASAVWREFYQSLDEVMR